MYMFLKSLMFCKITKDMLKIKGLLGKTGLGQFFKTHRTYKQSVSDNNGNPSENSGTGAMPCQSWLIPCSLKPWAPASSFEMSHQN